MSPASQLGMLIFTRSSPAVEIHSPLFVKMPSSNVSKSPNPGKRAPDLWKQAYQALNDEDKGRERLQKLNIMLKAELGRPSMKLRSEEGYQELLGMIQAKARKLENKKSVNKIGRICNNMMKFQDIVAAGAGVGGPYVAIPAAALFSVFSVGCLFELPDVWFRADRVAR